MKIFNRLLPQSRFKSGQKSRWGKLYGSCPALAFAQLAKKQHLVVIITADVNSANQLQQEIRFFLGDHSLPVLQFPDWEILPYDHFSPHQDIISARLACLYQLPGLTQGILILPVHSLMQKIASPEFVSQHSFILDKAMTIDTEQFRKELAHKGYQHVNTVYEHGEFSIRGSIIDIYPMGSEHPYRLDLFDDEIESIKIFDVETQLSQRQVEQIAVMPAREFPTDKAAIELFRRQYREQIGGDLIKSQIYNDITRGIFPAGIESYLPLFFEQCGTLFDFLPSHSLIVHSEELATLADNFYHEVVARYNSYAHDSQRPLLEPQQLFLRTEQLFRHFKTFHCIIYQPFEFKERAGVYNFNCTHPLPLKIEAHLGRPLQKIKQLTNDFSGRILFVCETLGRRESLLELLKKEKIYPQSHDSFNTFVNSGETLGICIGQLEQGLYLLEPALMVISESQLYGEQVMQRRRRRASKKTTPAEDAIIHTLAELEPGVPVVHEDNGVGRYLGMETLIVNEIATEFLVLEYQGGDKLYVPVASLHLISRYTGANPETAPLHKLGSGQWEKAKRRAREKIRDVAAELLEIYAQREATEGFQYPLSESEYARFCSAFAFEETADQAQAIEQVIKDMTGPRLMDRLICGDVGFGKTEVAMRAAFIAANAGKQVAILVPTTLLSQQHSENFKNRFAQFPIKIAGLSRFQTPKEQKQILQSVADGTTDIIIGTHKLLQKNIRFKNLGLLIIDEEHRFGVRQKEQFKKLRHKVDVLTMTATPIPRTLSMSLSGIRDFSIIATPPAKRLAIKTFVQELRKDIIIEACQRELMRGGQVFYLHNKVETINKRAQELAELLPQAKIEVAHGQMQEQQLEQVMASFYHQRFQILVCTTIIETGIDIPTCNTIIIERADRFGLAQLYQLRGRVGRSHHRAYAYLLTPEKKAMTADAIKRLQAIESIEDLGAGFTLATHDLEIRGAGELLGEDQSGQMQEIGFSLYSELLDRAVKSLKQGKDSIEIEQQHTAEINLDVPALIPDDYLPDVHNRLILYKRIANAKNREELKDLQIEMIDRFGLLPEQAKNLFAITALRLLATPLGILEISFSENGGYILFEEQPKIDAMVIIHLIQKKPDEFRLQGNQKLRLLKQIGSAAKRIQYIEHFISHTLK